MRGCSDTAVEGRLEVYGSVEFNGRPLPAGRIVFTPAPGTTGPAASGIVSHGSYDISAANGPGPGEYHVKFYPPIGGKGRTLRSETNAAIQLEWDAMEFSRVLSEKQPQQDFDLSQPSPSSSNKR